MRLSLPAAPREHGPLRAVDLDVDEVVTRPTVRLHRLGAVRVQEVATGTEVDPVRTGPARDPVVAGARTHDVDAAGLPAVGLDGHDVVPGAGLDDVRTPAGADQVVEGRALDAVRERRPDDDGVGAQHEGVVPLTDARAAAAVAQVEGDAVAGVAPSQLVGPTGSRCAGVEVVVVRPPEELVGSVVTAQHVVALAPADRVVAAEPDDHVGARRCPRGTSLPSVPTIVASCPSQVAMSAPDGVAATTTVAGEQEQGHGDRGPSVLSHVRYDAGRGRMVRASVGTGVSWLACARTSTTGG